MQLNQALELLHFAFRRIVSKSDRLLEAQGLNRAHNRILYVVARNPDVSVVGLMAILRVTRQALHRPLRDLLQQQLVASTPDPANRRTSQLRLTPAGAALEARISGLQRECFALAFDSAGAEAEQGWRAVMAALAGQADRPDPRL